MYGYATAEALRAHLSFLFPTERQVQTDRERSSVVAREG